MSCTSFFVSRAISPPGTRNGAGLIRYRRRGLGDLGRGGAPFHIVSMAGTARPAIAFPGNPALVAALQNVRRDVLRFE